MPDVVRLLLVSCVGLTAVQQHALCLSQRSVVWLRFDLQQFAHQRVDVDAVEGLGQEVLLKVGSEGPEDGLHVHLAVMEAVVTFVDVDDESLVGNRKVNSCVSVSPSCLSAQ